MNNSSSKPERVKLSFEKQSRMLALDQIIPLKTLRREIKESKKYAQVRGSIKAIGLVEAPVVTPDKKKSNRYFLLDGHLRIQALKELGIDTVECLISTDDEAYTYNKHINRISPIQEHRMITRAIERGAREDQIADALGLEVSSVRRRQRMLDGICPEAIDVLKDVPCPLNVFDSLRCMMPIRQIEAAELMVGQSNFSGVFAKALLAATPEKLLIAPRKRRADGDSSVNVEQIARMDRELASLQTQVKMVEETYGIDNLHLTVALGYLRKLLGNPRITRWLAQNRQEYLAEFQSLGEIESLGLTKIATA